MPIGAPPAPPARGTTQPKSQSITARNKAEQLQEAREEGLKGIAQIATGLLILTKNYPDAGAVDMHAEPICHEVAELAGSNEKIANIIDRLTAMGPYAGLITAVLPLAMQLAVNHDRIKPDAAGLFGGKVMSKEALAAKVSADIDKAKAAFLTQAREAQEEAAKAQEALAKVA